MGELTLGVPIETEYTLADRWSKAAKEVRDEQGHLLIWSPTPPQQQLDGGSPGKGQEQLDEQETVACT